jgi:hypothetical protein
MKKLLTILATCFLTNAAFATTNGLSEVLPIGSPARTFTQVSYSSSNPRPTGINYSVPNGDYRGMFLVFQFDVNGNNADYPTAVTYGGKAMTQVSFSEVIETNGGTTKFTNAYMFFLNESDISNRTNDIVNLTYYNTSPKNG